MCLLVAHSVKYDFYVREIQMLPYREPLATVSSRLEKDTQCSFDPDKNISGLVKVMCHERKTSLKTTVESYFEDR